MHDSTAEKNQGSVSEVKLQTPGAPATSENLPKNVSMRLYELMTTVVSQEVTPSTVHAACACASEIHKILKLNLDMKRIGL